MKPLVSICIACHNQAHLLHEALLSCLLQSYDNLEVIILDDASTDNPKKVIDLTAFELEGTVKYFRSEEPSGTGGAFNKAMSYAAGEYIVLLCSDDVFTSPLVISDIVDNFEKNPTAVHISRYYYQFIDGDKNKRPVRAWRCDDIIELANNPSGLAFRRSALGSCQLSNKMFVEASSLVACVRENALSIILPYDTVAVRIHQSISRNKAYYLRRWTSSPVEEWAKVGGKALANDFTSLIQIKNYFTLSAVIKECAAFIRVKPDVLLNGAFWFFAAVSILTPRFILRHIPHLYRITWGRWTTIKVERPR